MVVKGQHLMKKMKEIREMDRRAVLYQIQNVQKTLEADPSYESKTNIIENAINIVDRNKSSLAVGCQRLNLSQLEKNRIALGLLRTVK